MSPARPLKGHRTQGEEVTVARKGKRRASGKRVVTGRRERTEERVLAARVALAVGEVIWDLLREYLFRGNGPGRIL